MIGWQGFSPTTASSVVDVALQGGQHRERRGSRTRRSHERAPSAGPPVNPLRCTLPIEQRKFARDWTTREKARLQPKRLVLIRRRN